MNKPGIGGGLFSPHFDLHLPAIANLVGGGGKTSLILALLDEFASSLPVIYTTTTRIHPPAIRKILAIISCEDKSMLRHLMTRLGNLGQKGIFVVTRLESSPGLLLGVDRDFAGMVEKESFPLILNEADGARSMSIKFPRDGEPVLMDGADYLVPVIGLDCIGRPLGPETIFRWEIASARLSLESGTKLTVQLAASLLLHPEGVCKDWKAGVRLIPFINKADSPAEDPLALELAHALLQDRNFPVERVVWGSVQRRRVQSLAAHRQ